MHFKVIPELAYKLYKKPYFVLYTTMS